MFFTLEIKNITFTKKTPSIYDVEVSSEYFIRYAAM